MEQRKLCEGWKSQLMVQQLNADFRVPFYMCLFAADEAEEAVRGPAEPAHGTAVQHGADALHHGQHQGHSRHSAGKWQPTIPGNAET
eukprot:1152351-Pelagomonas_calceolata.AAC.2